MQDKLDKSVFEALDLIKTHTFLVAKSKGWHASEGPPIIGNYVANLVGEAAEFWEAYRKNKLNEPCDKAEKMIELEGEALTCAEEEIADLIIRVLDTAAVLNIDVGRAVRIKNEYNKTRSFRHGGKLV